MHTYRETSYEQATYQIVPDKNKANGYEWSEYISDALIVINETEYVIHINSNAQKFFILDDSVNTITIPRFNEQTQQVIFQRAERETLYFKCRIQKAGLNQLIFFENYTVEKYYKEQEEFFNEMLLNFPYGFLHCRIRDAENIRLIRSNETFQRHLDINLKTLGENIANKLQSVDQSIVKQITDIQSDEILIQKAPNKTIQLKHATIKGNEVVCFTENITRQLETEEARLKSERRLMLAQRSTSDALVDYDFVTKELYFSPRFYAILGYQENVFEPTLKSWLYLVHPEDRKNIVVPARKEILEGKDFFRAELRMLTRDQQWKWILARGQVVKRDASGNPLRIIGTQQDISKQKEQTRKVKAQENKLKRFINNLDGMVYRCKYDSNWTMQFVSEGASKLTEYEPEELINNHTVAFANIIHEDDQEKVWNCISKYSASLKVFDMVYRIRTKTGMIKWVHERGSFVFKDEQISHVEGVILDITKQKEAEEQLAGSEKKFRTYISNAPDGVLVLNRNQEITEVNKAASQLTEYAAEALTKLTFNKLIHGDQDNIRIFFRLIFEVGHASSEMRLRTGGKKVFYAMVSGVKLPDKKYLLFIKDINQRKNTELQIQQKNKAYQELNKNYAKQNEKLTQINEDFRKINSELRIAKNKAEESEQLKSAFLANMSHEIRTPMNGILGFSRLLINPNLSTDKRERYINVIEKSGDQLLALINNILDISKIETGQVRLNYESLDLNSFLWDIFSRFSPDTSRIGVELLIEIPEIPAKIETDVIRLGQVFTNLITNAMKFTTKGYIKIGYKKNQTHIQCFVEDTGTGINPEQQAKIFDRFHQVDNELFNNRGTGLGLAITKGLVEMLNGQISVSSNPGEGSRFNFSFPFE